MRRASEREKGPVVVVLRCKEQSGFGLAAGGTRGFPIWDREQNPSPWWEAGAGHLGRPRTKLSSYLEQSPGVWDGEHSGVSSGVTPGHSGACPADKTLQGLRQHRARAALQGREPAERSWLHSVQQVWDLQAQGKQRTRSTEPPSTAQGASLVLGHFEGFRWKMRNIKTSHCVIKRGVKSANSLQNPEYY